MAKKDPPTRVMPEQNTHTRFRRRFIIIAALIILITLICTFFAAKHIHITGDGLNNSSSSSPAESSEQPESSTDSPGTDDSQTSGDAGGTQVTTQKSGAEKFGFINLPDGWTAYDDPDVSGHDIMQYANPSGDLIITLSYTEDPAADAETSASSCWSQMEAEGASDINGATVTVAGCEAYQVYGYYADDDVVLIIWTFSDSSSILHYVSAEGPADSVMDAVSIIEDTFTL